MEEIIDAKQHLLLSYAFSNKDVFVRVARIIKPSYFEKPLDRVVEFVVGYFNEYHNLPRDKTIKAETGVALETVEELEEDDIRYLLDEIETHCQEAAMTEAILDSVDLVKSGNLAEVQDMVKNALMVKIDDNVGVDLFEDVYDRITNMDMMVDEREIGIPAFDNLIGNVRRGELLMVYAPSSGGKSLFLANVARLMGKQKLDICVVSLELNEQLYSKRMDSILTNIDIKEHMQSAKEISQHLEELKTEYGSIVTKKMPYKSKVSDLRTYLMEYHLKYGKDPDVLIVDYLALMGARASTQGKGVSEEQGELAVDLRQLCEDIDCYGFSAGQINREGQNVTDVHPGHVAGGMSVINGSDTSVALVANEHDIENNQVQCRELKLRNAARTTEPVILYKCPKTLRMSDKPFSGNIGRVNVRDSPVKKKKESEDVDSAKGKEKLMRALRKR